VWAFSESLNCSYIANPGYGLILFGATGDFDSDGLTNLFEFNNGMKPNNVDSEDDGLPDGWEVTWGTNPILYDALDDYDNDGYYIGEVYYSFTNINEFHAGTDPFGVDYDGDLLLDGFEYFYGLDPKNAIGNDGTYGDYDNDHVINLWEQELHTNPNDAVLIDLDGDFLWDDWELYYFGDISTYNRDDDVDTDGLNNGIEWSYFCNPISNDTDIDAITDYDEINVYGTDPTGDDTDLDGLSDGLEINQYGTNAVNNTDSDFDGLLDGEEHHVFGTHPGDPDSDNDLIDDYEEVYLGSDNFITDPNSPDTDQDTMKDLWEIENNLDPTDAADANYDNDSDGLINALEYDVGSDPHDSDSDSDTMPDGWEYHNGLDPTDETDMLTDPDGDGLNNQNEYTQGTDPQNPDCDYDGLDDSDEIFWGTDPWNSDCDDDNLTDSQEVLQYGTDPWLNDTDSDNVSDFDEVMGTYGYVSDPTAIDPDMDTLNDYDELFLYGTDPLNIDTDSDNINDYNELFVHFTNPVKADTDKDGLQDGEEIFLGVDGLITDPLDTFNPNTKVDNVELITRSSLTELLVYWDSLNGISQYEVKYKTGTDDWSYAYTSQSSIVLTGLVSCSKYDIYIKAQSSYNDAWSYSEYGFGRTRQVAPSEPSTSLSNYVDITVIYTLSSTATDLELWWQEGTADWELYDTYSSSGSVIISNLDALVSYSFKTRQRYSDGLWTDTLWSDYSTIEAITTQEPVPYALGTFTAISNNINKIIFSWTAPSNFQSGWYYKIYRRPASYGNYVLIKTTTSTLYNHYPPSVYTLYQYRIACFNSEGVSGPYSYKIIKVKSSGGGGGGGPMNERPDQTPHQIEDTPSNDFSATNPFTINTALGSIILTMILLGFLLVIPRYYHLEKALKKKRQQYNWMGIH